MSSFTNKEKLTKIHKFVSFIFLMLWVSFSFPSQSFSQTWISQGNQAILAFGSEKIGVTGISIGFDRDCNPIARFFYINSGFKSIGPELKSTRIDKDRSGYSWYLDQKKYSGDIVVVKSKNGGEIGMKASSALLFDLEVAKNIKIVGVSDKPININNYPGFVLAKKRAMIYCASR